MILLRQLMLVLLLAASAASHAEGSHIDWNDTRLDWHDYHDGLTELQTGTAPGVVILYADWCPVCKGYSRLFQSERVIKALDGLVLIRANLDDAGEAAWLVDYDNKYIPKTVALDHSGKVNVAVHGEEVRKNMFFLPIDSEDKLVEFIQSVKKAGG